MKKIYKNSIFCITIILGIIYLIWRVFFTIPLSNGLFPAIFGIILVYSEIITALGTFDLMYKSFTYKDELELVPIEKDEFPHIDVLIATHNEDADLLYKTINACTFMDYPDKSKVHIYICDDTNRSEIKDLADHFGVGYIGLEENKHAKSGNYNNALNNTTSPLIATFDADMIPQRSFLLKTVPYFFLPYYKKEDDKWIKLSEEEAEKNKKIGFIQTPQGFYNADLFQYNLYSEENIPNEQDFFSKEINILRNGSNSTVYTGSNTVISRERLESIGLFPVNTITEDYETGLRIQAKGYKTFSTSEVLACGITPNTIKGMISQRRRWARGVIQSSRNCLIPFNKGLSIAGNLSYLFGFSYWWSFFRRIIFILAPIMFALFDVQVVNCSFRDILLFWAPAYFFNTLSMRLLSNKIRNERWNQIIDTILAPFLVIPVFLETICISQKKFKVTDKSKVIKKDYKAVIYAIPNLILLVLSILAIIKYTKGKYSMALVYSMFIIFWLSYNIINLIYAMYFSLGRKIYRTSDRIVVKENIVSMDPQVDLSGITCDLSDTGLSFKVPNYTYFPVDRDVKLEIVTDLYKAEFKAEIIICTKLEESGEYIYRCKITDIDDKNKRQYLQIIHDRNIESTNELNLWMTTIDGIILNAHKRIEINEKEKRKMPRVKINEDILLDNNIRATLVDFNYNYILLNNISEEIKRHKIYSFILKDKHELKVKLYEKSGTSSKNLFKIINHEELIGDKQFISLINEYARKESI